MEEQKTTGQRIGMTPNDPTAANGSIALGKLPANNKNYADNNVEPIKDFSETTGRFVWDYQIDDDTFVLLELFARFQRWWFQPAI